ncbi:MAG: VOC family protein [bacterium]
MPTISHFEIPAFDVERAKVFYSGLFEWEFDEEMMDHWTIATRKLGQYALQGGLKQRKNNKDRVVNYIGVPSVDHYANRVAMLGGKIIVPKRAVSGKGYFAVFSDTEKNVFALWEDEVMAK